MRYYLKCSNKIYTWIEMYRAQYKSTEMYNRKRQQKKIEYLFIRSFFLYSSSRLKKRDEER